MHDHSINFRTPLVRLNRMSEETGCEILAKAEFCNGGGSVKDRAALFLIKQAEREGISNRPIPSYFVYSRLNTRVSDLQLS